MNRGACHQRIFSDESDYQYFMSLLLDTRNLYSFIVHAYCLMTNHYHLLIETKDEDISKIMKRINQFYTRYFKDMNRQLYREFVESRIRYEIFEELIAKEMGEDEL